MQIFKLSQKAFFRLQAHEPKSAIIWVPSKFYFQQNKGPLLRSTATWKGNNSINSYPILNIPKFYSGEAMPADDTCWSCDWQIMWHMTCNRTKMADTFSMSFVNTWRHKVWKLLLEATVPDNYDGNLSFWHDNKGQGNWKYSSSLWHVTIGFLHKSSTEVR